MSTEHRVDRGVAPVDRIGPADETQPLGPPPVGRPPSELGDQVPRRRRRTWLLVLAAAAAVVILVPLLVYAFAGRDSGNAPRTGTPTQPAPATSAPAGGPGATETAPTPEQVLPPNGRIPLSVLRNATLEIPAWPSDARFIGPSGRVKFTDGQSAPAAGTGYRLRLSYPSYGDVDRDGAQETVVNVSCGAEPGSWQVLAFDRDRAGRIVTLGRVVATTGEIKVISDSFAVTAAGTVRVRVGDYLVTGGEDQTITQWQTRGYSWRAGEFAQTAGPTAFGTNPRLTELAVTADDLVLGAPVDGVRHGTLLVTVTVVEPVVPDHLVLTFQMRASLMREGPAWAGSRVEPKGGDMIWVYVDGLTPPAVGTSRTYPFGLAQAAGPGGADSLVVVLGGQGPGTDTQLGEGNADNNIATVRIRTVG